MHVKGPGAVLLPLLLLSSCVIDASPVRPDDPFTSAVGVAIERALIPSPADQDAAPINRIRASSVRFPAGGLLDEIATDVLPVADTWEVLLSAPGVGDGALIVVYLYLIHVDEEGVEQVQFSGRTDPMEIRAGQSIEPDVPLVRGPLANLFTTGVTIDQAPEVLIEGVTAPVAASTTGTGDPPTVFWASLDPTVLSTTTATVTGLVPGVARLVASAGAFADTTTVIVLSSDTIGPGVLTTFPLASALGVGLTTTLSVTFDGLLDPTTVTSARFSLTDPQGARVPGTALGVGAVARFAPATLLDSLTTYTMTVGAGIRDLLGNDIAPFSWSFTTGTGRVVVDAQFDPDLGTLVGIGFDAESGNVFVYDAFGTTIREFTPAGTEVLPVIPTPGIAANDYDLASLPYATRVGQTVVPSNSLLVMNGEINPRVVYALDKDDGTVRDSVVTALTDPVGGSFHPARATFFAVDWVSDLVSEVDLATGETIESFPVAPAGGPAFSMNYGDLEVDPVSGNLYIGSSDQDVIRIMTPDGVFVEDIDMNGTGITGISGLAWDEGGGSAWVSTRAGVVYRLVGLGSFRD